jgi:hypothetical protein
MRDLICINIYLYRVEPVLDGIYRVVRSVVVRKGVCPEISQTIGAFSTPGRALMC